MIDQLMGSPAKEDAAKNGAVEPGQVDVIKDRTAETKAE